MEEIFPDFLVELNEYIEELEELKNKYASDSDSASDSASASDQTNTKCFPNPETAR